jgi:hypothetical protein
MSETPANVIQLVPALTEEDREPLPGRTSRRRKVTVKLVSPISLLAPSLAQVSALLADIPGADISLVLNILPN